jgi:hypothetical protein
MQLVARQAFTSKVLAPSLLAILALQVVITGHQALISAQIQHTFSGQRGSLERTQSIAQR